MLGELRRVSNGQHRQITNRREQRGGPLMLGAADVEDLAALRILRGLRLRHHERTTVDELALDSALNRLLHRRVRDNAQPERRGDRCRAGPLDETGEVVEERRLDVRLHGLLRRDHDGRECAGDRSEEGGAQRPLQNVHADRRNAERGNIVGVAGENNSACRSWSRFWPTSDSSQPGRGPHPSLRSSSAYDFTAGEGRRPANRKIASSTKLRGRSRYERADTMWAGPLASEVPPVR